MSRITILGLCGSLRSESTNMGLLKYAQANAPENIEINIADISELPLFNADLEAFPPSVEKLFEELGKANGLLLACPEYNYSIAPALKNSLDWASRAQDNHLLTGKPVAIMGSGGGMGTSRAQYHLRQVCVFLDLYALNKPEVFCNAFDGSFDENGNLVNQNMQELILNQLQALEKMIKIFRA